MLASISAAITAAVQRVSRRLSMQFSSELFGGNLHSIPASISATITAAFQQAFRRQFTQHFSEHFGGSYWSILVSIRWRSMEDLMRYFSGNLWPGLYDAKSSAYVKRLQFSASSGFQACPRLRHLRTAPISCKHLVFEVLLASKLVQGSGISGLPQSLVSILFLKCYWLPSLSNAFLDWNCCCKYLVSLRLDCNW